MNSFPEPIKTQIEQDLFSTSFWMPEYYIWGGSIIFSKNQYHLFASRWPKDTGFPEGYRTHSEIVRAVADRPLGPYQFQEVVLKGRGGKWWDGMMCHNPKIIKIGDFFVLYYIGSKLGDKKRRRKIGYAYSNHISGPWTRIEKPFPFGKDHNNPAPFLWENGEVWLAFRDQYLTMYIASAKSWNAPYKVLYKNIIPQTRVEDPDFYWNQKLYLIVEDNQADLTHHARFGALLESDSNIHCGKNWNPLLNPILYTFSFQCKNELIMVDRRERPELVNLNPVNLEHDKKRGNPTHLLTAIKYHGETFCHIQEI